ncbi:hypothetical protein LC593_04465 [Nostoc sp. CHAB 5844]|nr:hypothetical protein [Nostoc sp. CHAB 5844]
MSFLGQLVAGVASNITPANDYIAVPDLVRYVFKATNLGKQDLGVPQLLRKRYIQDLLNLTLFSHSR